MRKHPRAVSHYFFPAEASPPPSPLVSCLPGALLPDEVPRRLHSQEEGFSWGPQHQETWGLGDFPCSSKSEGQAIKIGVH